jgi:hypothetical protein
VAPLKATIVVAQPPLFACGCSLPRHLFVPARTPAWGMDDCAGVLWRCASVAAIALVHQARCDPLGGVDWQMPPRAG